MAGVGRHAKAENMDLAKAQSTPRTGKVRLGPWRSWSLGERHAGRLLPVSRPAWVVLLALLLMGTAFSPAGEPPLPAGLEEEKPADDGPALPAGLEDAGEKAEADGPALPAGLGGEEGGPSLPSGLDEEAADKEGDRGKEGDAQSWHEALPFSLTGFWEARAGARTQTDPYEKDASLGETRLQLQAERAWDAATLRVTADFLYDPVLDRHAVDLETGQGWVDLRETYVLMRPLSMLDLKVGRQVLTWGTGDLLFINDLFPKDWNAFFIGRDAEYLKAPSDAIKASLFFPWANLDVLYVPRFDADRFIDGRRISYYSGILGRRAGRDAKIDPLRPDDWFADDEWAGRLYRTVGGVELALYAYDGFWKSPSGMDPASGRATFPRLTAYGASVRGPVGKGIANLEVGYYDSADDRDGDDPFVNNSEWRFLVGYEQELAQNFTAGLQYYVEHLVHHAAYERTLPAGAPARDAWRQVVTLRLTKLLLRQDLELSLFGYVSPSDEDAYVRGRIHYKLNDRWSAEIGTNVFWGDEAHTFFGQFEKNTNVYAGVRWSF